MAAEKPLTPAYGSLKSLNTFFTARRDDGHITTVVDRSLMSSFSGSTANELLASLKFLKMIKDKGEPTPLYEEYVKADDEARKALLNKAIRDSYTFLWNTPGFDIERGTTAQMAEVFRNQGISGSTLARAVAFFLAAAKQADIKVSANIKAPAMTRPNRVKKEFSAPPPAPSADPAVFADPPPPAGQQNFTIPIPINRKAVITIPDQWSAEDWDLFKSMLDVYISGWKQMAAQGKTTNKDKGPTPEKEQTL